MRKILLGMIVATLSLTGVSRATNAPLTDDAQTLALWHMDQAVAQGTASPQRNYILDDDSIVANRNDDLLLGQKTNPEGTTAPTLVTGMAGFGNALSFNGGQAGIWSKTGGSWTGADTLSVDMWVKPMSNATEQDIMYIGGTQAVMECRWETNGTFRTWIYDVAGGTTAYVSPSYAGVLNDWNHIAIMATGTNYLIAITPLSTGVTTGTIASFASGGTFINSANFGTPANLKGDISIGAKGSATRNFTGQMDEVKIATLPEPVSMLLLGVGSILVLRNRKK